VDFKKLVEIDFRFVFLIEDTLPERAEDDRAL
jgi:hypothetical protein